MISMDQYEYIRTASRVYGKSMRQIARETGHSRNTLKKILESEHSSYKGRSHQIYPVLEAHLQTIEKWLTEDKERPKKQRHTARRIYHRLVNEFQFQGAESSVRKYVREVKARLGLNVHAFLPLEPDCGQEAEIDWGISQVVLAGKPQNLHYFCMRSKYSAKHFLRFYFCERQQAFIDAHLEAFRFFEGVFPILIYDNLTTAVKKVLQGKKREEQEGFKKFKAYYNFEARFCNPGQGHEKGGVEGMVGFVRRNYMVPPPSAETLQELNEKMLKECFHYGHHRLKGREKNVNEFFEEEKSHLLILPEIPYSNLLTLGGKTDKYATVTVEKNRYSVPCKYAGFKVEVLLYLEKIEIYYGLKKIATHPRSTENNEWVLDPLHYLELIQQRPQAFGSARPIRQWKEKWSESMMQLLEKFSRRYGERKGIKEFIEVLLLFKENKAEEVETAIALAVESEMGTSEGVKQLLEYLNEQESKPEVLSNWLVLPPPNLKAYDCLGEVE